MKEDEPVIITPELLDQWERECVGEYGVMSVGEIKAFVKAARDRDRCRKIVHMVILNLQHIETPPQQDEPGVLCGVLWGKVTHLCGMGSTTAKALCREFGADPDYDCGENQD